MTKTRKDRATGKVPERFEDSLERLESIVQELENGDVALDRALELFEEGVRLSRTCLGRLDEAEKKIEVLLRGADGTLREEEFDEGDAGAGQDR